jgi:hypothetical protein
MSATPEAIAAWEAERRAVWERAAAAERDRREVAGRGKGVALRDWPEPEVAARVAAVSEVPRAALGPQRLAQGAGWAVVATYARGTAVRGPVSALRLGPVVDSLALRCRRGRQRAVAIWVDGRFDSAFAGLMKLTLTRWRDVILSDSDVIPNDEGKDDHNMPQVAAFTGTPKDADVKRTYTTVDWPAVYQMVKDSGSPVKLTAPEDFGGSVQQAKESAKRFANGYTVDGVAAPLALKYERGENELTVWFEPKPHTA